VLQRQETANRKHLKLSMEQSQGCSLCQDCPLRSLLLVGLPRPGRVAGPKLRRPVKPKPAVAQKHSVAPAVSRCCMGFRPRESLTAKSLKGVEGRSAQLSTRDLVSSQSVTSPTVKLSKG
jgi:hypothetical protein